MQPPISANERLAFYPLKTPVYVSEEVTRSSLRAVHGEDLAFEIRWPQPHWDPIPGFSPFVPRFELTSIALEQISSEKAPPHVLSLRIAEAVRLNGARQPIDSIEVRGVEIIASGDDEILQTHHRLERALDEWFACFGSWLAARTGQCGSAIVTQRHTHEAGSRIKLFDRYEGENREIPAHVAVDLNWQDRGLDLYPSADLFQACDAAHRANSGEQLPAAHDLLIRAREWLPAGATRSCVVDAYASAEIAVFNWLVRHFSRLPEPSRPPELVRGKHDLVSQASRAQRQGLRLPADFDHSLKTPRDLAAHGATAPSFDLARSALRWAEDAIAAADPLAALGNSPGLNSSGAPSSGASERP